MQCQQRAKAPLYRQHPGLSQKTQEKVSQKSSLKGVHAPDLSAGYPKSKKLDIQKTKQLRQQNYRAQNNNNFIQMHQKLLQKYNSTKSLNSPTNEQFNNSLRQNVVTLLSTSKQVNQEDIRSQEKKQPKKVSNGLKQNSPTYEQVGFFKRLQGKLSKQEDQVLTSQTSFASLNLQDVVKKMNQNTKIIRRIKSDQFFEEKIPYPKSSQNANKNIQIFSSGFAFKTREGSPTSPGIFSRKQFLQYKRISNFDSFSQPNSVPNTSRSSRSPRRANKYMKSVKNNNREIIQRQLHSKINQTLAKQNSFVSNKENCYDKSFQELLSCEQSFKSFQKLETSQTEQTTEEDYNKFQLRLKQVMKQQNQSPPIIKATDISKRFQLDNNLLSMQAKMRGVPKSPDKEKIGLNDFSIKFL